jgi:hypothetical protein
MLRPRIVTHNQCGPDAADVQLQVAVAYGAEALMQRPGDSMAGLNAALKTCTARSDWSYTPIQRLPFLLLCSLVSW